MRHAFDADALIYAAAPGHPLGRRVLALFRAAAPGSAAGTGSVLLLPEVLGKPLRDGSTAEIRALAGLLARLDLRPVDRATAELATALSSRYGLRAGDATHLATAVGMGPSASSRTTGVTSAPASKRSTSSTRMPFPIQQADIRPEDGSVSAETPGRPGGRGD